jgi:hypothetical protein
LLFSALATLRAKRPRSAPAVLVEQHVERPVEIVLDVPVPAHDLEQALRPEAA